MNVIYGIHPIIEAIHANASIEKLFIQHGIEGNRLKELEKLIKSYSLVTSYVPVEKLNKLAKHNNHQGVVATISPIQYVALESLIEDSLSQTNTPLFLVLDQLTDVRNFGAIIRTAECTGVSGIIISKHSSAPVNAETIKTSAGAAFNMPICKVDHIKDAIYYLQASGINVIAATEKTSNLIYDIDFNAPTAIVMGSEGKGINTSVIKLVNQQAKLPLLGKTESLNVSVACGVFLYEALRQRRL